MADHDGVVWLIDVQKSRWSDRQEARFTVNGGVYVPGVVSAYSGRADPLKPKLVDCCVSARIGMLDDSRLDKWWNLSASDDAQLHSTIDEQIALDVADRVRVLLLPFLEQFTSRFAVANYLAASMDHASKFVSPRAAAQRHAYASLIYAALGNRSKALSEIDVALREAEGSPIASVIKRLFDDMQPGAGCEYDRPGNL